MAIGKLVLSGDLENGYIGASCLYFPNGLPIADASIQIISPYRIDDCDISDDIDGPFLGGHKSLQPCLLTNGSFFNGWTAIGPFATHSLADEFGTRHLEVSDNDENSWGTESPIAVFVHSTDNDIPLRVQDILANRSDLLNATIVLPHSERLPYERYAQEPPTPAYCRLYFDEDERQAVRVFYEGVLPDGETIIGGKLTDELLAQAHTWQGHAEYMEQTPYIVSGNRGWDEIVNIARNDKAGYQARP